MLIFTLYITSDKVNIISEGGIDNAYSACSNFDLRSVDEMTLGFSGIAGMHLWDGVKISYEGTGDYHDLWKNTFRALNHMNGDDVIGTLSQGGGYWEHGAQQAEYTGILKERYSIEHQYYTSFNKSLVVGYIKNRSYNIQTRGNIGSDCKNIVFNNVAIESPRNTEWNDVNKADRLRVNNLKTHTDYRVDWYSSFRDSNNGYIKSDCLRTNKKKGKWGITLEYPELTVSHTGNYDLPVVWYVIFQQNCNTSLIQQSNQEQGEKLINKNLLSIKNMDESLPNVYPNPFQNYILIQSPKDDYFILKSIEGKIIETYNIKAGATKINTINLSNGIYTILFVNQNQIFKLIKL
ncbi:MAG: T9SS type A sorting domain-containing protein [Brumimicrobium sp.]|nr:T9SS type A sorting domain-containing protein [Brumimicrobium sp.]